jgi:hypothetical protein
LKRVPTIPAADWDHNQSFSENLDVTHSGGVLIDPRVPSVGFVRGTSPGDPDTGFMFDAKSGKTIGPFITGLPKAVILAYDAVKYRLLTFSTRSSEEKLIDVWKVGSKGLVYQYSFSPYPPGTRIKHYIGSARFLDNDCVALLIANQLAVYDLANRKGVYSVKFDLMTRPQFASGLDYFFGLIDNHVVAVDMRDGEIVAKSPIKLETTGRQNLNPTQEFSVSSDLTRLVTMKRRYMEIFDLASGEKLESFLQPTVRALNPVFLDDENVLVANNFGGSLVNIRLRSAIWNYSFCNFSFGPLGSTEIWSSTDKSEGSVQGRGGKFCAFATPIPNQKSKQIIDSLELEDLIVLQSGDSVALDLDAAGGGKGVIIDQLISIGIKIDADSPNKLVAHVQQGGSSSQTYQNSVGGGSQTLNKTSEYFELALYRDGEKVWYFQGGSSSKDLGSLVILNEGETVQGKADADRIGPGEFFRSIQLPNEFIKVPGSGFYGRSKGTINGFEGM